MAAVTSALAAGTALAGVGMNIAQAVNANKQKKEAAGAAEQAAKAMRNIKEVNPFKAVQVPTLGFELAQQGIDRSAQAALGAAQGSGAEGVIGATSNLMQGVGNAELDLAAQAGDMAYQRDRDQATAESGIEERRAEREAGIETMKLMGAQQASSDAQTQKNQAIAGAIGGFGSALDYGSQLVPLYKQKKNNKQASSLGGGAVAGAQTAGGN